MSEITFEQVLIGIQSLPSKSRAKLREILNAPSETEQRLEAARELARAASLRDFSADRQWLKDHRDEYAGQWVALKYGQLISHGTDLKIVHAEAKAAGHPDALLELVEPSNALPFIF
jgi:hypothetical protein